MYRSQTSTVKRVNHWNSRQGHEAVPKVRTPNVRAAVCSHLIVWRFMHCRCRLPSRFWRQDGSILRRTRNTPGVHGVFRVTVFRRGWPQRTVRPAERRIYCTCQRPAVVVRCHTARQSADAHSGRHPWRHHWRWLPTNVRRRRRPRSVRSQSSSLAV